MLLESHFWLGLTNKENSLPCEMFVVHPNSLLQHWCVVNETFRCGSLSHVIGVSIVVMIPNHLTQWGSCRISIGGGVLCPVLRSGLENSDVDCLLDASLSPTVIRILNCCSVNRCLEPLVWSKIEDMSFDLCSLALVRSGRIVSQM